VKFKTHIKMEVSTNNLNLHIARLFLPTKFSTEIMVFSEIMELIQNGKPTNSVHLYNTIPELLHISKDAYRKALSVLIKKKLIARVEKNNIIIINKKLTNKPTYLTIKQI